MEGDTASFIVRIWREAIDPAGNVLSWKGYIEQVGVDRYQYFQDLDVMARFVQEQCRLPPGDLYHTKSDAQKRLGNSEPKK